MIVLVLVSGCGAATRLSAEWTDPAFRASSVHRLIVLGVTSDAARRPTFEDEFTGALAGSGIAARAGHEILGDGKVDSSALRLRALEEGADGVLVTRWVDSRLLQSNYSPVATYLAVPPGYASGWYSYYDSAEVHAFSSDRSPEGEHVRLEANLYRIDGDRLVWSALSGPIPDHPASWRGDMKACVQSLVTALKPRIKRSRS